MTTSFSEPAFMTEQRLQMSSHGSTITQASGMTELGGENRIMSVVQIQVGKAVSHEQSLHSPNLQSQIAAKMSNQAAIMH